MRSKRSALLHLNIGLAVMLVVTTLLIVHPDLREIGKGDIGEVASKLQRGGDDIEVTNAPYTLPDYLWDIKVNDGQTIDLRPLVPDVVTRVTGILDKSGIRIHIGQMNNPSKAVFQWHTGSSGDVLKLTLYDCLERPVGYWEGTSGEQEVILPGGLYKLSLSSEGKLGDDFKLLATVETTSEQPAFEIPVTGDIPAINIQMSEVTFQSWDIQRAALLEQLVSPDPVVTPDFKRVLANLETDEGRSTAQLWEAGVLNPVHFSPDTPSFTGKIVSGPLLFGMSRFKLYSIRTQSGILNYVALSIMYDEGLFVPRCILARTSLNGRSLGLYLLVETPNSDGFFAGVQRYDGQVVGQGNIHTNPALPSGILEQPSISLYEEFSREFSYKVDQTKFAKELAFITRLHATHSTSGVDFRLYRHPYLDSPEVVVRDPDIDTSSSEEMLLTHTSWWMGPLLRGRGAIFNPKVFPRDERLSEYTKTPGSFQFRSVQSTVPEFIKPPENRELFDQYLFYASDPATQNRFATRMLSAFEAVEPFLSRDKIPTLPRSPQPYANFDSELSWVKNDVDGIISNRLIIPRTIPALAKQSALLVSYDPPGVPPTPGTRTISLYNLSPFSARLKLPDYAHITETSMATTLGSDALGWYLGPSLLFPTVVPLPATGGQNEPDSFPITRGAAQRVLELERLRFGLQPDASKTLVPFVDINIPGDKLTDFMGFLSTDSLVTLAGTYTLPSDRNILVHELPAQSAKLLQSEQSSPASNPEATSPDIVILPFNLEETASGQRLSLLISNFSDEEVSLDLARLQWIDWWQECNIPYSIHAIWKLGEKSIRTESSNVTLGAARSQMGSSSPMIWTGALQGLLNGAVDESIPNCILAEFDLSYDHTTWMYTDANGLAESASADGIARKVVVQEVYEIYLPARPLEIPLDPSYQSPPAGTIVTVSSSHLSHDKESLTDEDTSTFWHVKHPTESSVHWVTYDLGKPITIEALAILPRNGYNGQLWDQDHAIFQVSNDPKGETGWVGIGRLYIDKTDLSTKGWEWLRYPLPNPVTYQYCRILVDDPSFLSLAEVKFKTREWEQPHAGVTAAELIEQGVLEVEPSPTGMPETIRFTSQDVTISGILEIPPGYMLEIAPGSTLRFARNAGILSYSPVRAVGTAQEPVVFAPAQSDSSWLGIGVINASGRSEFQHVTMNRAAAGSMGDVQFSGGLTFIKTSVVLNDVELIDFSSEDGLHLSNASYQITGLTIINSNSDALDSDWSNGTITSSFFRDNGGDGVDLSGSNTSITDCVMQGNADKGISVGEGAVVDITSVHLINNKTGIAVKDQAVVTITESEIVGNDYGVLQYIKKPMYIYPQLTLENNQFRDNDTKMYMEAPNSWTRRFD